MTQCCSGANFRLALTSGFHLIPVKQAKRFNVCLIWMIISANHANSVAFVITSLTSCAARYLHAIRGQSQAEVASPFVASNRKPQPPPPPESSASSH